MRTLAVSVALVYSSALLPAEGAQAPVRSVRGHFELVAQLTGGLTAGDSAVRARCAFLLGQIGSPYSAAAIRPLLRDSSRAVRYQAGIALCALSDSAGSAAAGAALASAAEWIRYYAVNGLAALSGEAARQTLVMLRPGQPELIGGTIDEALKDWPWPSVPPLAAARKLGPYDGLHDLFVDVGGAFVVESDTYWHKGNYAQCVRCNEAVTFLDPRYVEMYSNSAWVLWSMGDSARSISVLKQGIDANPKAWDSWFNLGYQYVLMKDYAKAARVLKRAVELGAPALSARQYCHALEKSGRPDLALEAWQSLLKAHPDDGVAPNHIARLKKLLSEGGKPSEPGGESA
jgi:tetratricopeptide (TPR) repeat protein